MTGSSGIPGSFRKKALVVLGMHRSGTSALAGLLHEVGIDMGPSLMPGRAGENDKGFWEHEKIVAIHDRLLACFGSGWADTRPLPPDWTSTQSARQYQDEICQVIEEDFGSKMLWALKDPRMCRLLPLWMPIFETLEVEPLFLFIVRNPLEVAVSLERRDHMSADHALLLWLQYNLAAVESTRGTRHRILTFPQLLEHGAPLLEDVLRSWSLLPARRPEDVTFLDSGLRHHVADDATLDNDGKVAAIVGRLYRLLDNAAAGAVEVEAEEWRAIWDSYRESIRLLGPWLELSEALRHELADRNVDLESSRRENEQLTRGLRHAESLLADANTRIEALDAALREAQLLVKERSARIEELDVALQEATRYVRQHEATITSLTNRLEQARAKVR